MVNFDKEQTRSSVWLYICGDEMTIGDIHPTFRAENHGWLVCRLLKKSASASMFKAYII